MSKHMIISEIIKTPVGNMLAAATTKGICLFEFMDVKERLSSQIAHLEKIYSYKVEPGTSLLLDQLKRELKEYFAGERQKFNVPLDYKGTEFQELSWNALLNIPYGETRSYQDQAIAIKKPKAVRAVAGANHRNKLSILIPCHRVIGKNGAMTGYGGKIWRKEFLLNLESNTN
ncbi:Methylated-DNA--protein-cysteine methyltransferase, constitutive [Nymphon striatum]|nr:Methylated-DNA--protein-cysteine methyltransferase, constitutive [Nymphon striatum]